MMLRLWRDHCSAYGVTIVPLASSLLRCASYCSYAAPLPYIITFCSNIFPSYFCASFSPVAFSSIASLLFASIASPHLASLHLASPRFTSSPIAHVFSLLLLVATLLVHPPLSLLPATLAHLAHLSLIYYFSLILLVATLLVHPPLSLLPATSPLPPRQLHRSYLLAIPPANSNAYHSSPSLPIPLHIWRLASRGPARVPSTVHSCPPSAPSPSPYPSFPRSLPLAVSQVTLNLLRAYPPFKEKLYFLLFPPVFLTFLTHTTRRHSSLTHLTLNLLRAYPPFKEKLLF